jgi:uncharacterized membrane protein YtjA (UPF0391 family)
LEELAPQRVDRFGSGLAKNQGQRKAGNPMLYWALVMLVIAIVAGILGFGAVSFAAAGIAKILFFLFLIGFIVSLFMHLGRRVP